MYIEKIIKILDFLINHLGKILYILFFLSLFITIFYTNKNNLNLFLYKYNSLDSLIQLFISIYSILIGFLGVLWTIMLTTDKLDYLENLGEGEGMGKLFRNFLKVAIVSLIITLFMDIIIFILNGNLKKFSLFIILFSFIPLLLFGRFIISFIISINYKN